jgi:hypothetical protein
MIKKEEELFDEWKKERPGFVSDGIVQQDNYLESGFKILYLLKEVKTLHYMINPLGKNKKRFVTMFTLNGLICCQTIGP